MNRKTIPLLVAATFAVAPLAKGQVYTGTVLYPLPAGFPSQLSQGLENIADGQAVYDSSLISTAGTVDLTPTDVTGIDRATAVATNGTQQVGDAIAPGIANYLYTAILWNETAASAVVLAPTDISGISDTFATATSGTQQVGYADGPIATLPNGDSEGTHAMLWTGTAASAVDLNPTNLAIGGSEALGTDGTHQVGYGYGPETGTYTSTRGVYYNIHALLWTGTPDSAVDLNPSGFNSSEALGTCGTQQVGYAGGDAMLWTGTAASAVELNPTGFGSAVAVATDGTQQVGYGSYNIGDYGTGNQALLWSGTADSAVELQTLLPSTGTWTDSEAESIDPSGNVYGYADGTFNGVTGTFAVEWSVTTLTWNNADGPGDGQSWDMAQQNWNTGYGPSIYTDGKNVIFNDANNAVSNGGTNANAYNVTLNTAVAPASIVVNNSLGNYTISGTGSIAGSGSLTKCGTGTLTLSTANTYSGGTIVSNGRLVIEPTSSTTSALPTGALTISGNGIVQLANNVTSGSPVATSNVNITSLSITGNGQLDIGNNRIIIDYGLGPDPIASIAAWIASGYAGGAWNGPGIMSTAPMVVNGLSYGIGYADGADPGNPAGLYRGEIEIMYTLLGDANLDGTVNSEDFTLFSQHLGQSGQMWDDGDFNYDGTVNAEDFTLFSSNLGQSATLAAAAGVLETTNGISLANVPEPMSAGMMVMAGLGILRRRRSGRRVCSK